MASNDDAVGEGPVDVKLYYIQYRPYIVTDDCGRASGPATEKVRALLDNSGLTYRFYYVPWLRAIRLTQREDNALIMPLTRNEEREHQFVWLTSLFDQDLYLYARDSAAFRTMTHEMAASGNYQAVCNSETVQCDTLEAYGFRDEDIMRVDVSGPFGNPRLVSIDRAQIFVGDEAFANAAAISLGLGAGAFRAVSDPVSTNSDYLAGGPNLAPEIRRVFKGQD